MKMTLESTVWVALILPAVLLLGCGGSAVYSCNLRTGSMDLFTCREYQDVQDAAQIDVLSADCMSPPTPGTPTGTWSEAACPRDGTLGGCMLPDDTLDLTLWYYPGNGSDAASVMDKCIG